MNKILTYPSMIASVILAIMLERAFITQIPFLTIFTIRFIITLHDLKRKMKTKHQNFLGYY